MIKWTKKEVIAAFQEAMVPQKKVVGNDLLQQLVTKAQTKKSFIPSEGKGR